MNKIKCCNVELISGIVFAFIAIMHLIRAVLGWTMIIGGMEIGVGLSIVIVVITGALAILNFKECRCKMNKIESCDKKEKKE